MKHNELFLMLFESVPPWGVVYAAIISGIFTIVGLFIHGKWLNRQVQKAKTADDKQLITMRAEFDRQLQDAQFAFESREKEQQRQYEAKEKELQRQHEITVQSIRQWQEDFIDVLDILFARADKAKAAIDGIVKNASFINSQSLQPLTEAFRDLSSFFDPLPRAHTIPHEIRDITSVLQQYFVKILVSIEFTDKTPSDSYPKKLAPVYAEFERHYKQFTDICMRYYHKPQLARSESA